MKNSDSSAINSFSAIPTEYLLGADIVGINLSLPDDEENKKLSLAFQERVRNDYIVTGGAITSMLLGDLPNDYDVYFKTVEVGREVAQYYVDRLPESVNDKVGKPIVVVGDNRVEVKIQSSGIASEDDDQSTYEYFEQYPDSNNAEAYLEKFQNKEDGKFKSVCITSNAISLSDKVQLIIRFVGNPEVIHENYDFAHTTNWFTEKDGVVLCQEALESILSRELKYVGSLYPICSMFRLKKFINRGWTITAGEMLKIAWDISKLDLTDVDVLRDQLTGVDAAYFNQLIRVIQEEGREIDRTYLVELINRIFDGEEG